MMEVDKLQKRRNRLPAVNQDVPNPSQQALDQATGLTTGQPSSSKTLGQATGQASSNKALGPATGQALSQASSSQACGGADLGLAPLITSLGGEELGSGGSGLKNLSPLTVDRGAANRLTVLLQTLVKHCNLDTGAGALNPDDVLQLRFITSRIQQFLLVNTVTDKQTFDLIIKNPTVIDSLLGILQDSHDEVTLCCVVDVFNQVLLNHRSGGRRCAGVQSRGGVKVVLSMLVRCSRDEEFSDQLILPVYTLLYKLSAKDRKLGLKARLYRAVTLPLNILRSATYPPKHLLPVVQILKLFSHDVLNATQLGKSGAVTCVLKIISQTHRKHVTFLKTCIDTLTLLVKSKSNVGRAISHSSVSIILTMFCEISRSDTRHKLIAVRRSLLNFLRNISNTDEGRQSILDSDGVTMLYDVCQEQMDIKEVEPVITTASIIMRKCFPRSTLPVPDLTGQIRFNLPQQTGSQHSQPSSSEYNGGRCKLKTRDMRLITGDDDNDIIVDNDDVVNDDDDEDRRPTTAADTDDEDDGMTLSEGGTFRRSWSDLKSYTKFFSELSMHDDILKAHDPHYRSSLEPFWINQSDSSCSSNQASCNNKSTNERRAQNMTTNQNAGCSSIGSFNSLSRQTADVRQPVIGGEKGKGNMEEGSNYMYINLTPSNKKAAGNQSKLKQKQSQVSSVSQTSASDLGPKVSQKILHTRSPKEKRKTQKKQNNNITQQQKNNTTKEKKSGVKSMENAAKLPPKSSIDYWFAQGVEAGVRGEEPPWQLDGRLGPQEDEGDGYGNWDGEGPVRGCLVEDVRLYEELAGSTRSAVWGQFSKLAYPDMRGHLVPGVSEGLYEKQFTIQRQKIFQDIDRFLNPDQLLNRVVYDLDTLTAAIQSDHSSCPAANSPSQSQSNSSLTAAAVSKSHSNSNITAGAVNQSHSGNNIAAAALSQSHSRSNVTANPLSQSHSSSSSASSSSTRLKLHNNDELRVSSVEKAGGHLRFESRFESGNLRKAIQIRELEYDLILSPDVNCDNHHQWFYFQISGMQAGVSYQFNIINCEKTNSQFNFGMKPVMYSVQEALHGRPYWFRTGSKICYYRNHFERILPSEGRGQSCRGSRGRGLSSDGQVSGVGSNLGVVPGKTYYTATFNITFRYDNDICYVAYHFPYTYTRLKYDIVKWEEQAQKAGSEIYWSHDTLGHTLSANPVPLLTITAQPRAKDINSIHQFRSRPYIFLSSRVHPGESNSSWVMRGTIEFLLGDSTTAQSLREMFIFKIVPMLNPDGVINGNHRCSLTGEDLNRRWFCPSPTLHPTIYHTKGLLQFLLSIGRAPLVFTDYHGHSRRKNVFLYGCCASQSWLSPHDLDNPGVMGAPDSGVEDMGFKVLPKVLHNIAPVFSLTGCNYSVERSKESTARVVVWRQIGVVRSYTMESTYCGCDLGPYKDPEFSALPGCTERCIGGTKKYRPSVGDFLKHYHEDPPADQPQYQLQYRPQDKPQENPAKTAGTTSGSTAVSTAGSASENQGSHITTEQLEEMGRKFVEGLLKVKATRGAPPPGLSNTNSSSWPLIDSVLATPSNNTSVIGGADDELDEEDDTGHDLSSAGSTSLSAGSEADPHPNLSNDYDDFDDDYQYDDEDNDDDDDDVVGGVK